MCATDGHGIAALRSRHLSPASKIATGCPAAMSSRANRSPEIKPAQHQCGQGPRWVGVHELLRGDGVDELGKPMMSKEEGFSHRRCILTHVFQRQIAGWYVMLLCG